MKKLFLLLSAGVIVSSASAQLSAPLNVRASQPAQAPLSGNSMVNYSTIPGTTAGKTTLGGKRWYNFVDLLIFNGSDVTTNFGRSFMTNKNYALAHFGATAGYDTAFLTSMGSVLDPSTPKFNDVQLVSAIGNQIAINSEPYKVDSIRVYGDYRRNPAKPNVVDTLRVTLVYGGNTGSNILTNYYFSGKQAEFGVDTVRFATLRHDTVKNGAAQTAGAPALVTRDILLTAASLNDTVSDPNSNFGGLNVFGVDVGGLSVPGNALVGASVTFYSGEAMPNWDTLQTATGTKYNHWSAWYFTEKDNQYQTYTPGDWNVGLSKYNLYFEEVGDSWRGIYVPSYAYLSPVWHENPLIEYKLDCATCHLLGVSDVNDVFTSVNAYPNPANNEVSIPFTLKESAPVSVTITNTVGQVMGSQNFGKAVSGKAVFSTANLAGGVYFYTVEANGARNTGRFVVAH
jgi:hypothetical protein